MKQRFVVSATYYIDRNAWAGIAVHEGVKGTHEKYNVVYNGVCDNTYQPTERLAKRAARKALRKYKSTLK